MTITFHTTLRVNIGQVQKVRSWVLLAPSQLRLMRPRRRSCPINYPSTSLLSIAKELAVGDLDWDPTITVGGNKPDPTTGTLSDDETTDLFDIELDAGGFLTALLPGPIGSLLGPLVSTTTFSFGPFFVEFTPLDFKITPSYDIEQTASVTPENTLTYQFSEFNEATQTWQCGPIEFSLDGQTEFASSVTFVPGQDTLDIPDIHEIKVNPSWNFSLQFSNDFQFVYDLEGELTVLELDIWTAESDLKDLGPLYSNTWDFTHAPLATLFDKTFSLSLDGSNNGPPETLNADGSETVQLAPFVIGDNIQYKPVAAGDGASLQAAVNYFYSDPNNSYSRVITVPPGTYSVPGGFSPIIVSNLTIEGQGSAADTIIDLGGTFRAFEVAPNSALILENVTIENGCIGCPIQANAAPTTDWGGAVLADPESSVTIDDCILTDNDVEASFASPALLVLPWSPDSWPTLGLDSDIVGLDSAGLLHIQTSGDDGTITNTFETQASSNAPLYLETTDASGTVVTDVLESSLSSDQINAIQALKVQIPNLQSVPIGSQKGDTLDYVDTIVGNAPTANDVGFGGAIMAEDDSTLTVKNSLISRNQAGNYGGGIFLLGAIANIEGTRFDDNDSDNRSTPLQSIKNFGVENNPAIYQNFGVYGGGAITETSSSILTINACTFSSNEVQLDNPGDAYGGAVLLLGGLATIINSTFADNSVNGSQGDNNDLCGAGVGSAIGVGDAAASLSMVNCTLSGNTAFGGQSKSEGKFYYNDHKYYEKPGATGGALYVNEGEAKVGNCIISGNSPIDTDGLIYDMGGNVIGTNADLGPLGPNDDASLFGGIPLLLTPQEAFSFTYATDAGAAENLVDTNDLSAQPVGYDDPSVTHQPSTLSNSWVTKSFANNGPFPTLTFLLPGLCNVTDVVVWGLGQNADGTINDDDQAKTLEVAFSTDGGVTFGAAMPLPTVPTGLAPDYIKLPGGPYTADVVQITVTSNYGGPAVGLGAVRFVTTAVALDTFLPEGASSAVPSGSPALGAGVVQLATPALAASATATSDAGAAANLLSDAGLSAVPTEAPSPGVISTITHLPATTSNSWVTGASTGPTPYFDPSLNNPDPVLTLDLGAVYNLSDIEVWGYAPTAGQLDGDEARTLEVAFSTDGRDVRRADHTHAPANRTGCRSPRLRRHLRRRRGPGDDHR